MLQIDKRKMELAHSPGSKGVSQFGKPSDMHSGDGKQKKGGCCIDAGGETLGRRRLFT